MEMTRLEMDRLGDYLQAFAPLIGDQRSRTTFQGIIEGIMASESLCASHIARFSPYPGQREMG